MGKMRFFICLFFLLGLLATGCADAQSPKAQAFSEPEWEVVTLPRLTTAPEETTDTIQSPGIIPSTQQTELPTVPGEVNPSKPVLHPPEAPDGLCSFYDDAAFLGDSITYSLAVNQAKNHDLENAQFLFRGSLGIHNSLTRALKIYYQGQPMTPWEALAASGAGKVFILLGTNDIGCYTVDETMELWDAFLDNIRQSCPDIQVYIQSQLPMWADAEQALLNNANIDLYNQRLQEFCLENDCHYVDIAPYFKNSSNSLAGECAGDLYVHLNEAGTELWINLLKAYGAEQEKETG